MRIPALNALYEGYLYPGGTPPVSFTEPAGEPALVPAGSVSWRVFSNPVSLFVGGVLAVVLELALPPVRQGVWEHSDFRTHPRLRLQRTGLAAMVTIYAARSVALGMIGGINRRHEAVRGVTPDGERYVASDEALLNWVQATAAFGFARAHDDLVRKLTAEEWDAVFAEGRPVARAYGAASAPASRAEWDALLAETTPRLEPSAILEEFLTIMTEEPVLPGALRAVQPTLVRVATGLVPSNLALTIVPDADEPSWADRRLARAMARAAAMIEVPAAPHLLARGRLERS